VTDLSITLLGAPQINRDDVPVKVDTRKAIALLAYLAVNDQAHTRDSLAAFLWPDYDQTRARAALRRTLSTLNKALAGHALEITRETVRLVEDESLWVDVIQFNRKIDAVATHTHTSIDACSTCLTDLTDAIALYQADFMAGFTLRDSVNFDDWQFLQSENLKRQLASALERLVQIHSAQQEFEPAISYGRRWLNLDPLREEAHQWLMRCYQWAGQRAAALRQYRECVRILDEELGVPPLEETTKLYQSILEGQLPPPEPRYVESQPEPAPPLSPAGFTTASYPLVGRSAQVADLRGAYDRYANGGYFYLIEGEAGIGKTRLAEEFIQSIAAGGAEVIQARCYEGEMELAYGPFIEGLRTAMAQKGATGRLKELPPHQLADAARLFPELAQSFPNLPAPPAASGPGAQTRFFESLRQVLLCLVNLRLPGVLFIDDVQWADDASLDLLAYLVHRLCDHRLFLLVAWRDEGSPADLRLRQIQASAQRSGCAGNQTLTRLQPPEIDELIHAIAPELPDLPPDFNQRLFAETEGLPFIVVEYLNATLQNHESQDISDEQWSLPSNVRNLLNTRLMGVSDTGNQLLSAAAVIGRSFGFATLLQVSGRSQEETLTGLEELLGRGLITEQTASEAVSPISYDFVHEKLCSLVYENCSLARRRLLHQRTADVLVDQSRGLRHAGTQNSMIARHYLAAGAQAKAADFFYQAGEHARSIYAHHEALVHFQAALSAGHPNSLALHEAIGEVHTLLGAYDDALDSFERAAALSDPQTLPRIEAKLGNIHARRGEWDLAACHYQAGIDLLGETGDDGQKARLLADWSWSLRQKGDHHQATSLAEQSLERARATNDPQALAHANNMLGILAHDQQELDQTRAYLEESLTLSAAFDDPGARIAALNNLSLMFKDLGDLDKASELAGEALSLCQKQGDRHREAAILNNLADLYQAAGDSEQAMHYLKQAVVIFAEIGEGGEDTHPEIWKLRTW
jgi:DNA-binding SARP family transcriptional activator/predicted ATPase